MRMSVASMCFQNRAQWAQQANVRIDQAVQAKSDNLLFRVGILGIMLVASYHPASKLKQVSKQASDDAHMMNVCMADEEE